MRRYWDRLFRLDDELSLWIEEKDLGTEKLISYRNTSYRVKMPKTMEQTITLRLRGLGKTRFGRAGDLYLHLWLNAGADVRKNLWLSESSAQHGASKKLFTGEQMITVTIPPKSRHDLTLRLRGVGSGPPYSPLAPALSQVKRGNLLVTLCVYSDMITPRYGSFASLSIEDMALEGWVYRTFDEVTQKLGTAILHCNPIQPDVIAERYNTGQWRSIFELLRAHMNLTQVAIELSIAADLPMPGRCECKPAGDPQNPQGVKYCITIGERFLDNPFAITAILAHELCHVVYSEKLERKLKPGELRFYTNKAMLQIEHTVDLLVFMFKIGEFQLRVARDSRLRLGYFSQDVFERMQVIVAKRVQML